MKDVHKIVASCVKCIREIPVGFLLIFTVISGLTLFLPESLAKAFALAEFRAKFRVFIGPAFWLGFSLLVERLFSIWRRQRRQKQALKKAQESLHHLTSEEKGYLAVYVCGGETILYALIYDKTMRGLEMKGIVHIAARKSFVFQGVPYTLHPWAREYLEKNTHLFEGFTIGHDFFSMNSHLSKPNYDSRRIGE